MGNHAIGSYWRRWDLHVHTPASHVQQYGNDEDAWDRFFSDLETLPPDFTVLGINDYVFLDGYKRVIEAKERGRLQNIETIFPVIELRLSSFVGSKQLNRVNFHVIFSDFLSTDRIESQFLNVLSGRAQLDPEGETWRGYISQETVKELGEAIRRSAPPDKQAQYTETDYELGMNNLVFDRDAVMSVLDTGSGLAGNYLTAIGKAEWDQFRWTDASIAEKKTVINNADAVFIAANDVEAFHSAARALQQNDVNHRLLDCSDAHHYSDSADKDRIGNCNLWIKADPTFEGLKSALNDYEDRVNVCQEPSLFERIRSRPRTYIKSMAFTRSENPNSSEAWFDNETFPVNPELVAIIGNRGQGKSALLDCIAYAGDSDYPMDDTSFLQAFRSSPDGKAADYTVTLQWHGGDPAERRLDEGNGAYNVPMVKHLPQHFIDSICNDEGDRFRHELETAIFSHVPDDDRLGATDLRSLVELRSYEMSANIDQIRREISKTNEEIVRLELLAHPDTRAQLNNQCSEKQQQLYALWQERPGITSGETDITDETRQALAARREELSVLEQELQRLRDIRRDLNSAVEGCNRIRTELERIKQSYRDASQSTARELEALDIKLSELVTIEFNDQVLVDRQTALQANLSSVDAALNDTEPSALPALHRGLTRQIEEIRRGMSDAEQAKERKRELRASWRNNVLELIGTVGDPGSIRGLHARINFIDEQLWGRLDQLYAERLELAHRLYSEQQRIVNVLSELYQPVQRFIELEGSEGTLGVSFEARLENTDLEAQIFSYIAQNRKGTFLGIHEGQHQLRSLIEPVSFDEWESVRNFLVEFVEVLWSDRREGFESQRRHPHDQIRTDRPEELYDYLFGLDYLEPQYRITLNGKSLWELSPGERGALLLVFYLLVDSNTCPLLIDQPEDNLDNQSVYSVLRPFIRQARGRRQVIVVTHNPNIAVAAGAEQIIHSSIDKRAGNRLSYVAGALENPEIRRRIVDVLEGTMPAFTKRGLAYRLHK